MDGVRLRGKWRSMRSRRCSWRRMGRRRWWGRGGALIFCVRRTVRKFARREWRLRFGASVCTGFRQGSISIWLRGRVTGGRRIRFRWSAGGLRVRRRGRGFIEEKFGEVMKRKVVGLGEVLWDLLPERTCLGGAPANFAYITTLMGDRGIVASRVGEDSRGMHALQRMKELKLDVDYVQRDGDRATGTVKVELDGEGVARFEIAHPVAWDFLEWTADWRQLAE